MIDLRTCEKGDILISSHGAILEYISPTKPDDYLYDNNNLTEVWYPYKKIRS